MPKLLFRSFAGGVITPEMFGRLDLTKFQTGLRDALNFITLPHGPVARRPGTYFTQQARDKGAASGWETYKVKLIPFVVSDSEAVVIEIGYQYMRFHNADGTELEASKVPTAVTVANPAVFTLTAHGYQTGDWLYVGSLPGMATLAGRFYQAVRIDADNFSLRELPREPAAAADISSVGLGPYTGSGSVARVYTLATTYSANDALRYAQRDNVMTLTGVGAARELKRIGVANWTLTQVSFAPTLAAPTGVTVTATTTAGGNLTAAFYVVTAVGDDGLTESLPSTAASANNNLGLAGNFNTVTWNPVTGAIRYNVYKRRGGAYGYIGQVKAAASGSPKTIQQLTRLSGTTTVTVSCTSHGFSPGDPVLIQSGISTFDGMWVISNTPNANTFTYDSASNSLVGTTPGSYGVASVPVLALVDDNVSPDVVTTPPDEVVTLNESEGEYPVAVTHYEQRRWFGGTAERPQNVWATRSGTESNLTSSVPLRADDAFEVRIASQQQEYIRHLVALQDVIALTASGEHRLFSDSGNAISLDTLSIKRQGSIGASEVQPALAEDRALYVQAKGSYIREIAFDSSGVGRFTSGNVSIMAPHLFDGYTVTQLAYTRAPIPALWALRSDGELLGMTHMPDQQVYGWHRHSVGGGQVESIAVIPEGNEDVLYLAVRRFYGNGTSVVHIERMMPRVFGEQEDAFFVDCGLTYSGTATTQIRGLWHLEGRTVNILADGAVETPQVVSAGSITLPVAASKVHIGLAYTSDLQTLPQAYENAPAGGQGTTKNVSKVFLRVKDSSLVKAGPRFNALTAYPSRQVSDPYGSPPSLTTGEVGFTIGPSWNQDGSICIRQDEPLPLTVLAIAHDTAAGG